MGVSVARGLHPSAASGVIKYENHKVTRVSSIRHVT